MPKVSETRGYLSRPGGALRRAFSAFFLLMALFLIFPAGASAAYGWSFDESSIEGWSVRGAEISVEEGALAVRGGYFPELYSPRALKLPRNLTVMRITIKSSKEVYGSIHFFPGLGGKHFSKPVKLKGGGDYSLHKVYIGDGLRPGGSIYRFSLNFPGYTDLDIESIDFIDPSAATLLGALWEGFWTPEAVKLGTINYISSPKFGGLGLPVLLYILAALLFICILAASFLLRRLSLVTAAVLSLALAALFFSIRMDYNWLEAASKDLEIFGSSVEERKQAVFGPPYDELFTFLNEIKLDIPEGRTHAPAFKTPQGNYSRLGRYYLLPRKRSETPDYYWTFFDRGVSFDEEGGVLTASDGAVEGRVELVRGYGEGAALFRRPK